MKKIFAVLLVISLLFSSFGLSYAQPETAQSKLARLKERLKASGIVKAEDVKGTGKALKNMLEKGSADKELQGVVEELSKKGVKGRDLRNSLNSMSDLVNNGESPKDAGSLVSQAVASAHAQGLKGKELAAKVHQAIKERKAQRTQLKKREREREREKKAKGKAEGKVKNAGITGGIDEGGPGKGKGQGKGGK